jgi:hypothetical protein
MQATKLSCPDCNATLQTAKPIPAGAKIKCPKCGSSFAAPAANGSPGPAKQTTKIAAAKTQPPPSKKSRPVERDDDDDESDDHPKKKKKFKNRKQEKSSMGLVLAIVGIVLLLVGGGIGAYFMFAGGDKKPDTAKNTDNGGPDRRSYGDNSGSPRGKKQPGDSNENGGQTQPTTPTGGGNTAAPEFANLDVGNLPAKQASQMEAVKYLPADCGTVFGLDVADLVAAQPIWSLVEGSVTKGMADLGLTPQMVDHIVGGSSTPLKDSVSNGGANDKGYGVVVFKTKSPYDAAKVKQGLKAGSAEQVAGKDIYKLPGQPSLLYMPSDTVLVLAHLPEDKITGLVSLKGDQPAVSADMSASIAKVGQAHAWMVISGDQVKAMGSVPAGGNMPPQMTSMLQPTLNALAKAKGGALSAKLQGKQVRLVSSVVCDDGNAARQLSGGLQMLWSIMGKAGLENLKTLVPAFAGIAADLEQAKFANQGELAQATMDISFASIDPLVKMSGSDWMNLAASMGGLAQRSGQVAKNDGGTPGAGGPGGGAPASGAPPDGNAGEGFEVGNVAPDISGKDTQGKTFKLSDYRGKVVVVDFWGFW